MLVVSDDALQLHIVTKELVSKCHSYKVFPWSALTKDELFTPTLRLFV
jgi:hypothetical protein